ncbi:MAG: hypothetical protein JZU50_00115 [Desulfobulbaceae bacterium]|nr:hypothetical protein [Desulfobulbaceae bacterium]
MKRVWLIAAIWALVCGGCVPYYYSYPYYYGSSYYGSPYYSPYYYGPYYRPYSRPYRPPAVYVDPGWLLFYPNFYFNYGYRGYRGHYPHHGGRHH